MQGKAGRARGRNDGTGASLTLLARMAFLLRKPIDPVEARLVLNQAEAAVRAALAASRREMRR